MIALIKACGYRVFMRKPSDEYCFYTDGTRIGYAQWTNYRTSVCSVHKANRTTGTGYQVAESITRETLEDALHCFAPGWAWSSDRATVKKYKDWNEYHNESKWNSELVEV